jgi:hypothetical protein
MLLPNWRFPPEAAQALAVSRIRGKIPDTYTVTFLLLKLKTAVSEF